MYSDLRVHVNWVYVVVHKIMWSWRQLLLFCICPVGNFEVNQCFKFLIPCKAPLKLKKPNQKWSTVHVLCSVLACQVDIITCISYVHIVYFLSCYKCLSLSLSLEHAVTPQFSGRFNQAALKPLTKSIFLPLFWEANFQPLSSDGFWFNPPTWSRCIIVIS